MSHPELDLAIRLILDDQPKISEFDLLTKLKAAPFHLFNEFDTQNQHQLFQVHFILFNVLFRLQDELPNNQALVINSVSIELLSFEGNNDSDMRVNHPDPKLKAYYLNMDNLSQTTEQDVEVLLDSFWSRYYKERWNEVTDEDVRTAMNFFGFEEPITQSELRKAFRKKCHDCHPDKGGNHQHFLELKRHYEMLKNRV